MRNEQLSISDLADITKSIADYQQLASVFPQYGPRDNPAMKDFLEKHGADKDYWKSPLLAMWNDISIHISFQTWGSTALGWGGMGGAAMTRAINVVIKQGYTGMCFVYWGGRLAYATHRDNIVEYERVPSLSEVKGSVYKHTR